MSTKCKQQFPPVRRKRKLRDMPVDRIMDLINSGDLDEDQFDELDEMYEELQRDK